MSKVGQQTSGSYSSFVRLPLTLFSALLFILVSAVGLHGCAGTVYQPYDGKLGYQEKTDSKGRLVITYFATDSTDWFTIGTFVDQRLRERKESEPCVDYQMVRDEQSEQRVTIQRQQDAQYTTVLGLNARWDIRTHEPIPLDIPATVRVYQRILKSVPVDNCPSQ
ncbi:hypothetical protein [Litoribrevibacter albus]|uniref:Uncharacterized protein n=1 Tax=Litoribrevibacter albus TaxID=1473156 RepID=A0AA37S6D3_9GAMM|nr:hypothetical protein [Litoribrevibacter albus]GLQ29737.1 hypothetical protein GCM10007876_02150 [Litoribrevibacter albus]